MKSIVITGGAGFIGSHVVTEFVTRLPDTKIINLDALTYAGNLDNLQDIVENSNYFFELADIRKEEEIRKVFEKYKPDAVIHLAAESHVDRSISNPNAFIETNVVGTANLLNVCREFWELDPEHTHGNFPKGPRKNLFYHISTDEVYGALGETGLFTEETPYDPKSPYSASKAASDHLVRSYGNTYGLPYLISNCSNNYGPNHYPEKLIPLCILNILEEKPLPIYGDGKYTRDWLYVIDHARAIFQIFHEAKTGETYNIGGFNEWTNIDLIKELIKQMDEKLGKPEGYSEKLITFVEDRPGHDKRYAIDATKLNADLGWSPSVTFEEGLSRTIDWYLQNEQWVENLRTRALFGAKLKPKLNSGLKTPTLVHRRGKDWELMNPRKMDSREFYDRFYNAVEKVVINPEMARQELHQIVEEYPLFLDGLVYLVYAYQELGMNIEVNSYSKQAFELSRTFIPEEFDIKKDRLPWVYIGNRAFLNAQLSYAIECLNEENFKEGIPLLTQILSLNPEDNQGVRYLLLELYFQVGEFKKAKSLLKKFKNDYSVEFLYGRVAVAAWEGAFFEANQLLEEAIERNAHLPALLKKEYKKANSQLLNSPNLFAGDSFDLGSIEEAKSYLNANQEFYQIYEIKRFYNSLDL